MLSASTSMPCASIAAMRALVSVINKTGASSGCLITAIAAGTAQWACTSTVLTRLPLTTTSRRRGSSCPWECPCPPRSGAAAIMAQPTKPMPPASEPLCRFPVMDTSAPRCALSINAQAYNALIAKSLTQQMDRQGIAGTILKTSNSWKCKMPASYKIHRSQLELILRAWGMSEATAISTAEIMSWADLHGSDTHGISMIPTYDERRRAGKIDMRAQPVATRATPVSALVDGGGGLGHASARLAMELAIEKAKATGIGVAVVRNSAHFGACGFYALMAVEAGLIGMVATSASGIQVAPTFGAQARLGTDPIAFAAPGRPGEPFLLDMATTTVAAGKIR